MKTKIFFLAGIFFAGFLGTNAQTLRFITTSGSTSTTIGAGTSLHVGALSGNAALSSGGSNAFIGNSSGRLNTSGFNNAFLGFRSGESNTTGNNNTFIGRSSGGANTVGINNSFFGSSSGSSNTIGNNNAFFGYNAGLAITSGSNNSIFGSGAAPALTTGVSNVIIGNTSGVGLTTGSNNVFIGKVTSPAAGTSNTVIIADGAGNQRLAIDATGNFNVGATSSFNKMIVTTGIANNSGLTITNLTNASPVSTTNNGRVLAVDSTGKVILAAAPAAGSSWDLLGNTGTSATTNFVGTTDNVDLVFKRNNVKSGLLSNTNTTFGINAGSAISTGLKNTFVGIDSGKSITSGNANLFLGDNAGSSGSTSSVNVFLGADAGRNATGNANTFVGYDSGGGSYANANGFRNIGIGVNSNFVPLGSDNILIGMNTSTSNTSGTTPVFGNGNTFIGNNISDATVSNSIIIGDGAGNQRIKIDNLGATTITGLSGTNMGKVLTADDMGKLQLVTITGSSNIYTTDGTVSGTASTRKMTMNGNNLHFDSGTTTSKIYIGTTPTIPATGDYKLFVEGGILTEKVRVALEGTTNWADYVFANDYKLMSLKEVENFYITNKHLPNVPSSQELVNEGLDIGAMQAKQMEKIEELTLYIVEQNKAIEILKAQVNALLEKK